MAELRLEGLGTMEDSAPGRSTKGKTKMISNILEWIRCFSLYVAILSHSAPHRVPDLLSYQALIIEAQMEYPGDHWLGYDRRFRQRAAVTKTTKWSKIDTTLWHLAFAGRPSIARCKYCFSVTHCSSDCELAPTRTPQHRNNQLHQAVDQQLFLVVPLSVSPGTKTPLEAAPEKTASLSTFAISVPKTLVSATRTTRL